MTSETNRGAYPRTRLRRNRQSDWSRRLMRENTLTTNDLIWPLFILEGDGMEECVPSMPEVCRYSVDILIEKIGDAMDLGVRSFALFPCVSPDHKTEDCRESFNSENLICRAVKAIKAVHPEAGLICDVALDPFNSKGHDGLVQERAVGDPIVLNDETIEILIKQSLTQAAAGCDVLALSDMMDGRVGLIRDALDKAGYEHIQIMSYAAKYASAFYGPFRDALGSEGALKGDKKTYQMDPANTEEALREVALDIQEGADMIIVKPGLPYLDIIHRVKSTFGVPTIGYHVSGEYAMLKAAAAQGWLDNDKVIMETLLAFKRAGADGIITYAAIEAAKLLKR